MQKMLLELTLQKTYLILGTFKSCAKQYIRESTKLIRFKKMNSRGPPQETKGESILQTPRKSEKHNLTALSQTRLI